MLYRRINQESFTNRGVAAVSMLLTKEEGPDVHHAPRFLSIFEKVRPRSGEVRLKLIGTIHVIYLASLYLIVAPIHFFTEGQKPEEVFYPLISYMTDTYYGSIVFGAMSFVYWGVVAYVLAPVLLHRKRSGCRTFFPAFYFLLASVFVFGAAGFIATPVSNDRAGHDLVTLAVIVVLGLMAILEAIEVPSWKKAAIVVSLILSWVVFGVVWLMSSGVGQWLLVVHQHIMFWVGTAYPSLFYEEIRAYYSDVH